MSSRLLKSLSLGGGGPLTKCPYLSDTGFLLLSLVDSWSLGSRLLLGCPPCFLPQWLTPPAPEFASPRRMSPDFQLLLMLDGSALRPTQAACASKTVLSSLPSPQTCSQQMGFVLALGLGCGLCCASLCPPSRTKPVLPTFEHLHPSHLHRGSPCFLPALGLSEIVDSFLLLMTL